MKDNHKILFEPYQLAGCTLKNRYVMAAMGTGGMVTAENTFNERGIEYYVARAKGGVGLIITGTIYAENDIEMLKAAQIGAVMCNAFPGVREYGNYVTVNDNNHDGVSEIIHKFILKDC